MKARLTLIVASVIIPLIAGCGEDSDELLWGQSPFVAITSPADQSEVFGITKITVDAMDNTAISFVELLIDGEAVEVLSMNPYEYDWDTTELDDLSIHTIYAKAVDDRGHTKGTNVISVRVRNAHITGSTYTNWKYRFRISAPSPEWTVNTEASLEIDLPILVSVSSGLYGASTAMVGVGVEAFTGGVAKYQPLVEAEFRDVKIGDTKDTSVDDIPAKEILIRYTSIWLDIPAIKGRYIYFTRDGAVYFIIAVANERAYPLYESDFDEVIETFEFL